MFLSHHTFLRLPCCFISGYALETQSLRDSSVISTFSWGGGQIFLKFFNATRQLKIWKKQHFICSNLTLFVVPFFLFSLFFSFFLFFLFFLSFFLFFFFLGGGGRRPPSPPQMTPLLRDVGLSFAHDTLVLHMIIRSLASPSVYTFSHFGS